MKRTSYLILLLAVILSACSTVPLTNRKQFLLVSDQEVLALGLQSYNEYISTAQPSPDTVSAKVVEQCGVKIQKAVDRQRYQVRPRLYEFDYRRGIDQKEVHD